MTESKLRIDKWMWFARIVKTRTLAQKLVTSGKVRVDKVKITSASHKVSVGNVLTITLPRNILIYEILQLGTKRGPYVDAQLLYSDQSPPAPVAEAKNEQVPKDGFSSEGRPDKRQRRQLKSMKSAGQFGE